MGICTLHLLRLKVDPHAFVKSLQDKAKVLLVSIPQFFVVKTESIDTSALNRDWDLMLLLQGDKGLPADVKSHITEEYLVKSGIPSKLINDFAKKNHSIRAQSPPKLTGSLDKPLMSDSSQPLALSEDLQRNAGKLQKKALGLGPVTMLNLLAFHDGMKETYYKYGQGFAQIGGKRGGNAKIVGNALDSKWDEIAIVHYPTINHFCDMLAGEDYQEVNKKYRLKALKDTLLICTLENDADVKASKL